MNDVEGMRQASILLSWHTFPCLCVKCADGSSISMLHWKSLLLFIKVKNECAKMSLNARIIPNNACISALMREPDLMGQLVGLEPITS